MQWKHLIQRLGLRSYAFSKGFAILYGKGDAVETSGNQLVAALSAGLAVLSLLFSTHQPLFCSNSEIELQPLNCGSCAFRHSTTNLVDSASSHLLVSRIKPCKSESKRYAWVCERLIKTETIYTVDDTSRCPTG